MSKFSFYKPLYYFGWSMLLLSLFLIICIPNNQEVVLGINSLIKPLKFSLSTWIYAWTMSVLLNFLADKTLLRKFTWIIILVLGFEIAVITIQAWNGQLSHFNMSSPVGSILFSLMGILISFLTLYNLYVAFQFRKQEDHLDPAFKLAVFLGMIIFVIGSFLGGVMGGLNSHQVGGNMGEAGLPFLNWSTKYGDLRIAHFIGIHALQIIPLFGYVLAKQVSKPALAIKWVWVFSFLYLTLVLGLFLQAMMGMALI